MTHLCNRSVTYLIGDLDRSQLNDLAEVSGWVVSGTPRASLPVIDLVYSYGRDKVLRP